MRLKPRVDALERHLSPPPSRWVRVIQHEGQTVDQAYAKHERMHEAPGDADVILRVIMGTNQIADELCRA